MMNTPYSIKLSPAICPEWVDTNEFLCPVLKGLVSKSNFIGAEVLATYQKGKEEEIPLIVKINGDIKCLFNVEETISALRNEDYPGAKLSVPIVSKLPFDYKKLPIWFIGFMSRILISEVNLSGIPEFPQYPIDQSSDIIQHIGCITNDQQFLGDQKLIWPDSKKYAIVFTHDVDSSWIFNNDRYFKEFIDSEEQNGVRSAWYTVPLSINTANVKKCIKLLCERGHEIGAHGYDHCLKIPDLPWQKLTDKLSKSFKIISDETNSDDIGYRSPWLSRNNELCKALAEVGFLYDTSFPTCDFHRNNKESNNGCCTVFPFMKSGIPVLPVTLPQDVMHSPLGMQPDAFWNWIFTLTNRVKKAGGVVVISTHLQPHHSANEPMIKGYRQLMQRLAEDDEAWHTLPKNVINWYNKTRENQLNEINAQELIKVATL